MPPECDLCAAFRFVGSFVKPGGGRDGYMRAGLNAIFQDFLQKNVHKNSI